tara:strand:- start:4702 stop:6435 length:1734 start_codon:yes stop_codon:yes gene_type:complete
MSRARVLSEYANFNSLAVDTTDNEVGIASTVPRSTLDVRGELKVGTAIQAGTAGVVTATEFSGSIGTFSGAGSFGGNLDVTGNVTIGGTLTYEDVTNIDSVGIVTARAGVNVSGGQITVGVAYSVGNAGVVTATGYHGGSAENVWTLGASGTSHYTFTGPGDLSAATDPTLNLVRGQRYRFKNRSGGHPFQIQREYQNTSGTAYNDGVTNNAAANGTDLIFDVPYDAPAILYYQCTSHANMSGYLYIGGSGYETKIGTGITIGSAGVGTFADGSTSTNALKFGSSGDLSIYHDGSHSYIKDSGTGELRLSTSQFTVQNAAGNETLLYAVDNAGVGLKYQDSLKFETTSGGAQVTGTLEVTSYISQNDGIWHYWGTGDDLGIQHDGSNAIIRNGTGNIRIEPKNGELGVRCIPDGTTELYYDNSKKFATTNDGVSITGIATVSQGLNTDGLLSEKFSSTAGKLSDNTTIDLENGMVHYFTTQETTTSTPNIRYSSSKSLNNMLSTGDAITVTIITTAAAAGYSANVNIDGNGQTEEWVGGSAPSSGGSDGLDIYTYNILKTSSSPAYKVIVNVVNATN